MIYLVILVVGIVSFLLALRSLQNMQKMDDVATIRESLGQNRVLFHKDHSASSGASHIEPEGSSEPERPEDSVPGDSKS